MTMRKSCCTWFGVLIVWAGICWTGAACSADAIVGSVLAVRGAVFWDVGGHQQPLLAKTPVHQGDTIVSTSGKAKIALDDGTIISVGENSRVRITDHSHAADDFKTRLSLISGVLRLLVAKVTPNGTFEVETETAIAAVRGTDWVIEATPERTSVALVSGVVAVSGRDGQAHSTVVLDAPGQGTDVHPGSAPTATAHWGAERFNNTLARATFE
jgi:hypothetical protein